MNTTVKGKADKAPNYSAEQEQALRDAEPISFNEVHAFANEWGKSWQSVLAKVHHLGLEYIPKEKPSKKVSKGDTKKELVSKIETALGASDMLSGLEKATASALVNLLGCAKVALREAKDA